MKEFNKTILKIMSRTTWDLEFRTLVLTEPEKAYIEIACDRLPKDIKIRFIEKPPMITSVYVLPDFKNDLLDDSDLNNTTGGSQSWFKNTHDINHTDID